MEITWYGHSCFRFSERSMATVVSDPYDHSQIGYSALKLKAEILTISHNSPGHNFINAVKGGPYVIAGPGEYEIGGVFITGVQTNHSKKGSEESRNTIYLIDYNGINILHLGNMNRVPTQAEVEALGPVHIALVPVGGGNGLTAARAAEVVSLLEPNIVIPMHYSTPQCNIKLDSINKFLKEMGLTEVETQQVLKISGKSALPEETRVMVLDHNQS